MAAGDVLLVHRDDFASKLISWGQGLRDSEYKWATHAAIDVGAGIAEALVHQGVVISPANKYDSIPHVRIPLPLGCAPAVQDQVIRFALHAVGKQYGMTEDVSLGFYLLTGTHFRTVSDNQLICSAYVAECRSRAEIFDFEPLLAMPGDLAKFYDAKDPRVDA